MSVQMYMFAQPIQSVSARGTIEERFALFHERNPQVYRALVSLAREYRQKTGKHRIGIKMLFERVRWGFSIYSSGDADRKFNNDFTSLYARLIMQQEPDLADAFETRRLRGVVIATDELIGYDIRTSIDGLEPFCVPCAHEYLDWSDASADYLRSRNLGCEILASDDGAECLLCVKCGCPLVESVSTPPSADTATACVNAAANDKRPGR